MFGRMMNETLGRIHFWITFIGAYCIFMPMHYLGMAGNPRRYSQFTELNYLAGLIPMHKFITYAAFVTIGAQLVFLFNLFWSMFKGEKAALTIPGKRPLLSGLPLRRRRTTISAGVTPRVHHGPYEYSVPGMAKDYVMQTDAATVPTH